MSKIPFDIRNSVPEPGTPDKRIQRNYDIINVSVTVIGDLSFGELFSMPMLDLVNHIGSNVDKAIASGAVSDGEEAKSAIADAHAALSGSNSTATLAEFFATVPENYPSGSADAFGRMREVNFCIPFLSLSPEMREGIADAIAVFLNDAGSLTLRDLYTVSASDASAVVQEAIRVARKAGLLPQKENDYRPNATWEDCIYSPTDFCNIGGHGGCSLAGL